MLEIPLHNSTFTVRIDDADLPVVSQYNWRVGWNGQRTIMYARATGPNNTTIMMHRLLLGLRPHQLFGDHFDGNGLNNTRENLRVVTRLQNAQNRRVKKSTKSGARGVHWNTRKHCWHAVVKSHGKKIFSKHFHSVEEAAQAASNARLALFSHTNESPERVFIIS